MIKDIADDRSIIRKKLLSDRKVMAETEVESKSELIFLRLVELEKYRDANNILIYSDYANEVRTSRIIEDLKTSGRNIFLPVLAGEMQFIACEIGDKMRKNRYGINEPIPLETSSFGSGKIDIAICPGVGFDYNLNRIGHGKGYFDRFLKGENAYKIGLAYDFQVVDSVFPKEHDVPMDIVITEKAIYKRGNI